MKASIKGFRFFNTPENRAKARERLVTLELRSVENQLLHLGRILPVESGALNYAALVVASVIDRREKE